MNIVKKKEVCVIVGRLVMKMGLFKSHKKCGQGQVITTAGTDRNSICFEQHQKAIDIIEGRKIDK